MSFELCAVSNLGKQCRDLFGRIGHMNEAARNVARALFDGFQKTVEAGVAKKGAGARRWPHRNSRCQKIRLDLPQRQRSQSGGRSVAGNLQIAAYRAFVIGNLEVGEVDAHPFQTDHRFARPQPDADDRRWADFIQEGGDVGFEGSHGHGQLSADDSRAANCSTIEGPHRVVCRVAPPSAVGLETCDHHRTHGSLRYRIQKLRAYDFYGTRILFASYVRLCRRLEPGNP